MLTNYEISFYLNKLDNFNFDLWTGQKPNTACGIHWYECWHEQGRMLDGAEYDHVWSMFFFSRTNRKKISIWEVVWCGVLHVKVISLKSTHWIFRMFQHVRSRLLSGKSFMKVSKASLMVVNFSNSLVRNSSMAPRELTPKPGKPGANRFGICRLLRWLGLLEDSRCSRGINLLDIVGWLGDMEDLRPT